jgi:hypothetical protein
MYLIRINDFIRYLLIIHINDFIMYLILYVHYYHYSLKMSYYLFNGIKLNNNTVAYIR